MKKITLLFMLLCSFAGFSQLAHEGFEGATFPPAGWSVYNIAGPAQTWVRTNPLNPTGEPPHTGTYAAYLNRENVASGLTEDFLVTPIFNVPNNPMLRFWSRLSLPGYTGSIYKVMILPEGANAADPSQYVQLQQWTEAEINPSETDYTEVTVNIPDSYIGEDVRLAFVMQGDNFDRWLVDDVEVVTECVVPTDLTANNITLTSANLSWANPSGATAWDIELVLDTAGATGVPTHTYNGALPFVLTGLPESTCYKYYVRARCSD